jgi:hypothetical protein
MESYYIKINFRRLLIALFFGVFLTGSFGIILLLNLNGNLDYDYNKIRLIIGLIFTSLSIFLFLKIINYFPTIKIDKINISIISIFKTKIYPINEFERITVSEITEYYGFLTDRISIRMKNDEKLELYSFKYSNFSVLRKFLALLKGENIVSEKSKLTDTNNDNSSGFIKFNDSHIISFTGITFYILIGALLVGVLKDDNFKNNFFEIVFSLIVIIQIFSGQMNYFILTKDSLIIKNSIKIWKKDIVKLNNIKSIEINQYYKQPGKSIIIRTYDYKVIEYSSDNLWGKTWIDFKQNIISKTITLKDNSKFPNRKVTY